MARSAVLSFLLLAACGTRREALPPPEYPGVVRAPAAYEGDFVLDHTITAEHTEGSETFRAVVEKRGDTLVMVALGPHGGRAFTLRQDGDAVAFESQLDRELPFPPRYVLLDFHRTWLAGLPGAPLADGDHSALVDGERVTERWDGGRLLERRFEREDGSPPGVIVVTYEGGLSPDPAAPTPTRVVLDNGWFRYRLVVTGISLRGL